MRRRPSDASCAEDKLDEFDEQEKMWRGGWRRWVFPALWLVYLAQVVGGVQKHSAGAAAVVGYVIVLAFALCYIAALPAGWSGDFRRFWWLYSVAWLLTLSEAFFAHGDAFVFFVYLAVLTVATDRRQALPLVAIMAVIATVTPRVITSWGGKLDWATGLTILLTAFAMFGFFQIIKSNQRLASARAEVARLAAENERSRIARDLHDLLGHSLTTITIKAALARRLTERDPIRAAQEIAEVEELSRRSLADVRAAVSGYRDVTLAGELASAREVLRATAVAAELPGAVDIVDPQLSELFGWVVREGITNVVRHARASRCTVTLGRNWIEIVDDGRGGTSSAGNGLTGLKERVEAASGRVEVGGCPRGWRLRVDVPGTAAGRATPAKAPRSAVVEPQQPVEGARPIRA